MTTPLVSRAESGLRPPRATPARIDNEAQTAHYGGPSPWGPGPDRSSAAAFRDSTDHNRCASILRAWQAYHMDVNGWNDLAYNSAWCPHGVRYEGRGVGRRSGANGTNTGNARSCASVYIAGDDDPVTDEARHAYLDECERFGVAPRWQHGDHKPTACAGEPIRAWKAAGWPRPGPIPAPPTQPPELPPEDDMPGPMQEAKATAELVDWCYRTIAGREPDPGPDGAAYWYGRFHEIGPVAGVAAITEAFATEPAPGG